MFRYRGSLDNAQAVRRRSLKVAAGSTRTITPGQLLFEDTDGYWKPVTLVVHCIKNLAVADEQQLATDPARYLMGIIIRQGKFFVENAVFEVPLDAAEATTMGQLVALVAGDAGSVQTVAADATNYVGVITDDDNYPETGVDLSTRQTVIMKFLNNTNEQS